MQSYAILVQTIMIFIGCHIKTNNIDSKKNYETDNYIFCNFRNRIFHDFNPSPVVAKCMMYCTLVWNEYCE